MKKPPELFQGVIDEVADYLGITRDEAVLKLEKPYGLKQLLIGKSLSANLSFVFIAGVGFEGDDK
jgi:hypothetical protein